MAKVKVTLKATVYYEKLINVSESELEALTEDQGNFEFDESNSPKSCEVLLRELKIDEHDVVYFKDLSIQQID